ncbi:hypothetical protein GCM10009677_29840 [Sphaerisporangium rubeum]|uniref:Uncharacterized protein n=1 Tax=Sphaerisporangium rubeum TaxID=321317 RepID=A0A7X0M8A2_9ACTN|nr:SGNH/GDSL hydrolase family protein [Sphaerisporangium rubeum]MBB6473676.1 hypothetical protein [Sphaerisporangium rubeum]
MVDIKNVVVLGDSMSDIGNKWLWPTGELGRLFRAMRVNETGRFSDGKNWADFLVEWSTGETLMWGNRDLSIGKSTTYRTLSGYSVLGVADPDAPVEPKVPAELDKYLEMLHAEKKPTKPLKEIRYVNYAMGGAIVTNDWSPKFGALTYLRSQVEDYIAQRKIMGTAFSGPTLHVIWIGLNDFVTATRPDYDPNKIKSVPSTADYSSWLSWSQNNPKDLSGGVGVFPAVAEIQSLVELINSSLGETAKDHHFVIVDLPSVYNAIRFMEGLGDPSWIPQAKTIEPVIRRYNEMLESLVNKWPVSGHAPANVHLVKMSAWMDYVSENLETWELSKKAQDKGVRVFYNPGLPPEPKTDPVAKDMRRRITTSDLAHPTEAVYGIIARYFVTQLLENGYTLGRLRNDTWPRIAPFPKLPFDVED